MSLKFRLKSIDCFLFCDSASNKKKLYLSDVPKPFNGIMLYAKWEYVCMRLSAWKFLITNLTRQKTTDTQKTREKRRVRQWEKESVCATKPYREVNRLEYFFHGIRYGVHFLCSRHMQHSEAMCSIEIQMWYRKAMNKIRSSKKTANNNKVNTQERTTIHKIFKPHVKRTLAWKMSEILK